MLFLVLLVSLVNADKIVLEGDRILGDGKIFKSIPDTNFATNEGLTVRYKTAGSFQARSYIKINISALSGETIIESLLCLTVSVTETPTDEVSIYHINKTDTPYDEAIITWNTGQPCGTDTDSLNSNCNSTRADGIVADTLDVMYCFNVTTATKQNVREGVENITFLAAKWEEAPANVVMDFASREHTTVNKPSLNVTIADPPDTTFPIVNVSINNTVPIFNDVINITANMTDETGLQTANITINFSTGKVFFNYTISGTAATIWNDTTITDTVGHVLNITVYVEDTSGNTKQNSTVIIVGESTCDCPASGNWEISDGSTCELTAACDLGTNRLRIIDGALRIMGGGVLRGWRSA